MSYVEILFIYANATTNLENIAQMSGLDKDIAMIINASDRLIT